MIRKLAFGGMSPPSWLADLSLTLLRVGAGVAMALAHGWGKVPPTERFVGVVEGLGFPLPLLFAWAAGLAELIGGFLLAIGLLTRPAAFSLVLTMAVAFFLRHGADPFQAKELSFLYGLVFVVFAIIGSGRFGIDRWARAN